MIHALYVGLGGFLGAVLRWGMSSVVQRMAPGPFPYGTLLVNVVGCLAIGWFHGAAAARGAMPTELRAFVFVGLLGGFTTFSTFAHESLDLGRELGSLTTLVNIGLHVVLGLLAVWVGYNVARV